MVSQFGGNFGIAIGHRPETPLRLRLNLAASRTTACKRIAPAPAAMPPLATPSISLANYLAAGTQALSADANSTPATGVVILTACNPAFLPGLASNVSMY